MILSKETQCCEIQRWADFFKSEDLSVSVLGASEILISYWDKS